MWARFTVETLVLLAGALAALPMGWHLAGRFVVWASAGEGAEVVMTSPSDYAAALSTLAVALALPFVVGWAATLVHRLVARRAPPPWLAALATGVPLAMALMGAAWWAWWIRGALLDESMVGAGIVPMLAVRDLSLGEPALRWGATGAVLTLAVVTWRARRLRAPTV